MALIIDNTYADQDEILVCHIDQWKTFDVYASNQLALDNINKGRYKNVSLLQLETNSEGVYQKLKSSVDNGNTVTVTFNVPSASKVANYFVPISQKQLAEWTGT